VEEGILVEKLARHRISFLGCRLKGYYRIDLSGYETCLNILHFCAVAAEVGAFQADGDGSKVGNVASTR
jgi:hypothetical protein